MSCGCNTNGCDEIQAPPTSATGKKISQLNPIYQLSANDLFVVVDVNADGPNTADVTKNVSFETVTFYDNSGTTLTANVYQDAITELDNLVQSLSGVSDAPDNNTYLRTNGVWVQSDVFINVDHYDKTEVDGLLVEYATSANLEAHIVDYNNPHQVDANDVGLSAVDNTSDLDKPISTATQVALDLKENNLGTGSNGQVLATSGSDVRYWIDDNSGGIDDAPDSNNYVRTDGAWVQTDIFNSEEYATSADLNSHITTLDIHRVQDDAQTTSTTLWSSSKIKEYVDDSAGGGATLSGPWRYSNTLGAPSSGRWSTNNADPSLATEISIHDVNGNGFDTANILSLAIEGTRLYIQSETDNTKFYVYDVIGAPVDNTTYYTYPVSVFDEGVTDVSNNERTGIVFLFKYNNVPVSWGEIQGTLSNQTDLQTALDNKVETSLVGANNGVAELDASGTVPVSQLPDAVLGALEFKGTWNANTNTPTLSDGSGTSNGEYYKVSVAGTTPIDGISDWEPGDWIINVEDTGSPKWDKIDQSEIVTSVFSRVGNVTAQTGDYTTGQVTEVTDKNYVTDAEKVVLGNTSNTNTGDETTGTIQTKRPLKTVEGNSLEGAGNVSVFQAGNTASRPGSPTLGLPYFDTDLGYQINYNGTNWVNSTGAIV